MAGGTIKKLSLEPAEAEIYPAARKAILAAQLVIVGPACLYTSILANLLVPGVVQALRATTAHKIYVCNVMTQRGETDNYSAADHLRVLEQHVGKGLFDTVLINNNLQIPAPLLQKYAAEGAVPVQPDVWRLQKMGVRVVA